MNLARANAVTELFENVLEKANFDQKVTELLGKIGRLINWRFLKDKLNITMITKL